jgi:organic radical activating enzyme
MKRLRALLKNIEAIRFLGGEPLLHPETETINETVSTQSNTGFRQ